MTIIQGLIYCVWLCGSGSEKWFTFLWSLLGYTVPILHVRNVSWRSYHVSNVTQLLSGSPGPWMLQPSESRLGFSTKRTLKGSGLWFVYIGPLWEGEPVGLCCSKDKHLHDLGVRIWLKPHSTLHPCLPNCVLCGHDRGPCPSLECMPTVTSAPWLSPSTAPARSPRSPPGSSRTSAGPAGPWPHGAGQPQGLSSPSCHWQERWYPRSPGTCLGRGKQGCCWYGGLPPGRWNSGRHWKSQGLILSGNKHWNSLLGRSAPLGQVKVLP